MLHIMKFDRKKYRKLIILGAICVIMLLCYSFSSVAAETIIAQGKCGDNIEFTLYSDNSLIIKGSGRMYDYRYKMSVFYDYAKNIENVYISDDITYIGNNAFTSCKNLKTVQLGRDISEIGNAFKECDSLSTVYLTNEEPVTGVCHLPSLTKLAGGAFAGSTLGGATNDKYGNHGIKKVIIDSGLKVLESNTFLRCIELSEVELPDTIIEIESGAFNECDLTKFTFPKNLEVFGDDVFGNNPRFEGFSIGNNKNFALIDGVFFNMKEKTLLNYPEDKKDKEYFVPEGIEIIGLDAFKNNPYIESVTLASTVKCIQSDAFSNCSNLYNVNLSDATETIMPSVFPDCNKLKKIYYPSSLSMLYVTKDTKTTASGTIISEKYHLCSAKTIYFEGSEEMFNKAIYTYKGFTDEVKSNTQIIYNHKHTYIDEIEEATCQKTGLRKRQCKECGYRKRIVLEKTDHTFGNATITKEATTSSEGEKFYICEVCGFKKVITIPKMNPPSKTPTATQSNTQIVGLDMKVVDKKITETDTDKDDVSGSSFSKLTLIGKSGTKKIKLSWKKVKNADRYIVYGSRCGSKMKKIKTLKKTSYTSKKLQAKKWYKYIVVAEKNGKVIAVSKTIHIPTNGSKYATPSKITLTKSSFKIVKGKTAKIKGKVSANKKIKQHIAKFRYESTNPKIASVSKTGKIKAKKKGTCYIYVYAQSGIYKKVKVQVK